MRTFVVVFALTACAVLGALACGDGNNKPPLTPDQEHLEEAGAPATPSTPSPPPATPPAK